MKSYKNFSSHSLNESTRKMFPKLFKPDEHISADGENWFKDGSKKYFIIFFSSGKAKCAIVENSKKEFHIYHKNLSYLFKPIK